MRSLASRYGASPAHLVGHLALFAASAWAIANALDAQGAKDWIVWFVGAALLHDLVVLPLYTLLDRALLLVTRARTRDGRGPLAVPLVNHVRVPFAIAAVVLLVSFPLVLRKAPGNLERVAGFTPDGFGLSYVLLVIALFALSGLWYVVRLVRVDRRDPDELHPAA